MSKGKNNPRHGSEEISGWLEIALDVHPTAHEALGAFFFDLGCQGVISQGFHDRVFRAYLPLSLDSEDVRAGIQAFLMRLGEIFPEARSPKISFEIVENRDWDRVWRSHYRPLRVSEKLLVIPAWEPPPSPFEGVLLRIDPGPAFGTGEHPTTRMCLRAVEQCADRPAWTMLDVGTGSGILAVCGAKLGAGRVLALDNDPEALRWAERNIALNEVAGSIRLSSEPLSDVDERFTVVAANLVLDSILELMPLLCRAVEPGGRLILSGILDEQAARVRHALRDTGFSEAREVLEEEWVCLTAERDRW